MQARKTNNKNFIKVLGNIIEKRRKHINKSAYLISAESSIAKSTWRELETGQRKNINLSTFCKVAEGLDMAPDELLKELLNKLGKDFSFTDLNS